MPKLESAGDTKYQHQLPTVSFRVITDDKALLAPAGVHSVSDPPELWDVQLNLSQEQSRNFGCESRGSVGIMARASSVWCGAGDCAGSEVEFLDGVLRGRETDQVLLE
jgi:hypothetical protein